MYFVFVGAIFFIAPNAGGPGGGGGGGAGGGPPPAFFIPFFACFGVGTLLMSLAMTTGTAVCARCISKRRGRIFCYVMSGFNCMQMPIGTLLGVFTIIVLSRDSVRELFEETARAKQAGDSRDEIPPPVDGAA
jgi:hypothetical protein